MLLLGVDEGTTGVKAALFDERLQPVREARRDKVNRHPQPGGSSRTARRCSRRSWRRSPSCSRRPTTRSWRAGSTTRASRCSPGTPRPASRSARSSSGRTSARRRCSTGWAPPRRRSSRSAGCRSTPTSPPRSSPGCSRTRRRSSRRARPGTLRMGTVDSFLCDRLGAGFATDNSTASRTQLHRLGTPGFDERLCELFGVPLDVLPEVRDTAGELGTLRHESWPVELPLCGQVVDQQAALAGAGCVVPGRVKATYGTGVFVLGHVGDEVPRALGRAAAHGGLAHRRPHGVRDRRRRVRRGRDARVDVPRARDGREPRRAHRAGARARTTTAARACCPGLAGVGAPWWKPDARAVIAGMHGGTTRANVARAALEGIAWRVADVVAAMRETRRGRLAARGRRAHQRAAAASAPGRHDRRARGRRRRRRDRARRRGAGRRGRGRDPLARRRRPSCCRSTARSSRSRTTTGARASTNAGRRSCSRRG